jgi:hypothetical protein
VALMATFLSFIPGTDNEDLGRGVQRVAGTLKAIFGEEGLSPEQKLGLMRRKEAGLIPQSKVNPETVFGAPNTMSSMTNNNNFTFNIDGSKNPAEVAKEIKTKISDVTNNAFRQNPIAEGKPR